MSFLIFAALCAAVYFWMGDREKLKNVRMERDYLLAMQGERLAVDQGEDPVADLALAVEGALPDSMFPPVPEITPYYSKGGEINNG